MVTERTVIVLALVSALLLGCNARFSHKSSGHIGKRESFGAVWDDPLRCDEIVRKGKRLGVPPKNIRVGSWNVRWFPDGRPGDGPPRTGGTNVRWLACAVAWLGMDVVALQEIKLTDHAKVALGELTKALQEYTGVPWQAHTDICSGPARQHLAFLHRTDRVELVMVDTHPEIDPTLSKGTRDPPCSGFLRPALAGYVRSKVGGVDFHFVTTHLDSGRRNRDFTNRKAAWKLVDKIGALRQGVYKDNDVIVAADFNSMGCPECNVPDSSSEVQMLRTALSSLPKPMRALEPAPQCTEYYRGRASILDHIVVSQSMQEAQGRTPMVQGLCGALNCADFFDDNHPVLKSISDHCPIIFDVADFDDDSAVAAR